MSKHKQNKDEPYDEHAELADEPIEEKKPGELSPDEAKAALARFDTGGATAEERDAALAVLGDKALTEGKDVDPEEPDK